MVVAFSCKKNDSHEREPESRKDTKRRRSGCHREKLSPTKGRPCRTWQRQVFSEGLAASRSHEGCFRDQEIPQLAWFFVFLADSIGGGSVPLGMGVERWA
jgi:hypothetical protein